MLVGIEKAKEGSKLTSAAMDYTIEQIQKHLDGKVNPRMLNVF